MNDLSAPLTAEAAVGVTTKHNLSKRGKILRHIAYTAAHQELARQAWMKAHPLAEGPGQIRPWGEEPEAPVNGPWWGVQRLDTYGRHARRAIFRHRTLELAQREAEFLAFYFQSACFAVLEMKAIVCIGEPFPEPEL